MSNNPIAVFDTSLGEFSVELFADKAPVTVENFVTLAKKDYYNETVFHRIIAGFMIQGGDPTGTGRGGPGYNIKDEFHPELRHDAVGILSMANAGPNTGGSQFFITVAATPWLDNRHSVFGKVVKGLNIVEQISNVLTDRSDRPLEPVVVNRLSIQEG